MYDRKVIALLPMKGHSERVPHKNMRDFCGLPLFHWILDSLLKSKYISQVVINTDSDLIAENALKHFSRVSIHKRPDSICGDHVSMNEIISHDLSLIAEDHFLQTHSTNPLVSTDTIDRAIELYFDSLPSNDSLFSVNRLQTRLYDFDGKPINHDPALLIRTQDLKPIYEENSNLYIFSKNSFEKSGRKRIGSQPVMFEVDKLESVDIDEVQQFTLAEMLCQLKLGHRPN